jgi:hypothetical protein
LKYRFRLPQHRRRVDRRAPRRRKQFGGAKQHCRAILPRPAAPLAPAFCRRGDCLLHVLGSREVIVGKDVLVIVRHDCVRRPPCPDFLPADHQRNLDALSRHLFEPCLQFRALRRAGCIRFVRLIHRLRDSTDATERGKR